MDVSYNDMHGKIPGFRKDVVFVAGNPQIEKLHVISRLSFVWIGIGIGLLVAGVIRVLYYYVVMRKKGSDSETEPKPTIELKTQASSVVTERVVASDDNAIPFHILRDTPTSFSDGNFIGKDEFSAVYRDILPDETDIAVK
ncbi:hypothetical protein Rs2_16628 [Raphanus sativus]|nr:hypothetical protein Rs2_16628 [Raphanus sativus]